jgi:hypothetical protein
VDKTGLSDFGSPFYEAPLAAWIHDLNTQNASEFGRSLLRKFMLGDLIRRLKVIDYINRHSEILEVEVPPILMIMGAPRTGTTLLHNLAAIQPQARPLLRWELMEPLPAPESATYTTDPRIAQVQALSELMRGSVYEQMHWVNADDPEENTWGFISGTGLLGRGIASLMLNWNHCLGEIDHRPIFREFRNLLQLLIWRCPPPTGGHLVLKCPMTAANIQAFSEVFPEANFALMHRDPFRVLLSSCTISEGISEIFLAEQPSPMRDEVRVQELFEWVKTTLAALMEFVKAEPKRVSSIRYSDFMDAAVSATHAVYGSFGISAPDDLENGILRYLEQQREGARISPPKSYDTFGFDHDAVWSDPVVAEYCEFFDIPREQSRMADTKTGT